MSRYIDADNAIERLGAYLMTDAQIESGGLASEDIDDWKPIAIDILKGAPSIDIVRCKECKYAHMTYGGDCKYCDMWKDDEDGCIELYLDGDFYCAYGERTPSIGMTAGTSFDVKADDFCSYGEREGE